MSMPRVPSALRRILPLALLPLLAAVPAPALAPDDSLLDDAPAASDDLLGDDLLGDDPAPRTPAEVKAAKAPPQPGEDPHAAVFAESLYPAATTCAQCHQQIYDEWAASNHAYSSLSPMFHKFEQAINDLSQGTIGSFCVRCHATVGTSMGEPRELPLWKRAPVSREGVTCVTCHRVSEQYGRASGQRRIETGDIHEPVYGNLGGAGVAEVIGQKDYYKVKASPDDTGPGMKIHAAGIAFEQLSSSEFCLSCHQVAVHPGIKLEVVWDQYRDSPAFEAGHTCQECHMGRVPGVVSGYATGPAAVVGGKAVNPERRHSNHAFYGPGYPIAHPGIFPHGPRNGEFSIEAWLQFDHRAGWGTREFEDAVYAGKLQVEFPAVWRDSFDRETAREIVAANLVKLEAKRDLRRQVMENGSHIDGPFFSGSPRAGKTLEFHYRVTNTNPGHNMPSGSLGAQPEIWLNVALIDPSGRNVWESGHVDSAGDMADLHSADVAAGKLAHDDQLFNLQTKFLTTNVKGTDREMALPVNFDVDQIPFIRPAGQPTTVLNHPPGIRMEGRSIPPLASREARYVVPGKLLREPGTYRLAVRLRSRAEPIYFMRFVGATAEMEQAMNEWMIDLHAYTVEFDVR